MTGQQSKLKIEKTRLSHDIRRHKWQDNLNLTWNKETRVHMAGQHET